MDVSHLSAAQTNFHLTHLFISAAAVEEDPFTFGNLLFSNVLFSHLEVNGTALYH